MRRLLLAIVCGLAGLQPVLAQSTTATLSGTVSDSTGASVRGAAGTATSTATGFKSSAVSNNDGALTITLLPPGKYTILTEHAGFAVEHINDVVLELGARFVLQINPNAYYAAAIGSIGPYLCTAVRRGLIFANVSVFKNIPLGKEAARRLQLRLEMFNAFNHTEFNGTTAGTQLTTPTGATGSAVFATYPNVAITNNLRPAGSAAQLGQFFGEFNSARDPRIIQLGAKIYF